MVNANKHVVFGTISRTCVLCPRGFGRRMDKTRGPLRSRTAHAADRAFGFQKFQITRRRVRCATDQSHHVRAREHLVLLE
jgi:hypothetical protein